MRRMGLRSWIRQQRRLERVVRARHALLRRLMPGRLILEHLGLVPRRSARRWYLLPAGEDDGLALDVPAVVAEEHPTEAVALPALPQEEQVVGQAEPAQSSAEATSAVADGRMADASRHPPKGGHQTERLRRPPPASFTPPPAAERPLDRQPPQAERRDEAAGVSTSGQADTPAEPERPKERTWSEDIAASIAQPPPPRPDGDTRSVPVPTSASAERPLQQPEPVETGNSEPEVGRGAEIGAGLDQGVSQVGSAHGAEATSETSSQAAAPHRAADEEVPASEGDSAPVSTRRLPERGTSAGAPPVVMEQRRARRPPSVPRRDSSSEEGTPDDGRAGVSPSTGTENSVPKGDAEVRFARTTERSVSEWRRLLIEATSEPTVAPAQPARPRARPPAPQLEPVLESTRRFLHPLVGVDPASVRIDRSFEAGRAVDAAGADALAAGDTIAFPVSQDERTPEGLGLLAHELTHVARRREPRFVPPIARSADSGPRPSPAAPGRAGQGRTGIVPAARGGRLRTVPPAGESGEEEVALGVEGLVRAEARAVARRETVVEEGGGRFRTAPNAPPAEPEYAAERPPGAIGTIRKQPDEAPWGDLPAPWEPLPDLPPPSASVAVAAAPQMATAAGVPAVHAAASDRSVDEPSPVAQAAAPRAEAAQAPDLDALARQVYEVLKRRLAAERRREG